MAGGIEHPGIRGFTSFGNEAVDKSALTNTFIPYGSSFYVKIESELFLPAPPPMLLEIKSAGEPVLRQKARNLTREEVLSPAIQQLIENMRETMHRAPGVGLAAPQIGLGLQLAVIEDKPEYMKEIRPEILAERQRRPVPFHVIINPKLTLETSPDKDFFEGCLSVPGLTALTLRASRVKVECLDHRGDLRTIQANGWHARILQHEIDHLNGTLYIDRMEPRSLCTLDNYSKHWKEIAVSEVRKKLTLET
jgi:peptide deformylase